MKPGQSHLESISEVIINTGIGIIGAWFITFYVVSTVTDPSTATTTSVAGCTIWSLVRSWVVRRWFNRKTARRMMASDDCGG